MSNIYVLYHAGCNDGFGAAWIAHKHLGDARDGRRVRYLPQSYGGEPPRMGPGSRIYILDFSYPLETMLELHRQHESVILLDHHETARDALEGRVPDCHFDLERSGATIAWEYWGSGFSTNEGELLARYIEDRDLWRWKLPDSREVSAALDSHPKRFQVWDRLDVETLAREGTGILRYIRTQVENLAGMAQEQELAGYRGPRGEHVPAGVGDLRGPAGTSPRGGVRRHLLGPGRTATLEPAEPGRRGLRRIAGGPEAGRRGTSSRGGLHRRAGPVGTDEPGRLRVPAGAVAVLLEQS